MTSSLLELLVAAKNPKNVNIVRQFTPPECVSKFSFCFYLVAFSIGYIVVYSIFFLGAVLDEKGADMTF